ncbi:MAG: hypothetical protein AAFV53_05565 [Myxococcota bacterium]
MTERPVPSRSFEYIPALVAALSVGLLMILPMFMIKYMATSPETGLGEVNVGATVGLGVLLRTGGRTMLRSTVMGAARTMVRALTRRIVRSFLPMMMRLFLPAFRSTMDNHDDNRQALWWSLGLGAITLAASFYGVAMLSGNQELLGGLSAVHMSMMAAVPLVLHYALFVSIGRLTDVAVELRTDIDGVLLQGYFTGAMSYLPLASDIELEGTTRNKGICAAGVLFGFLVAYTALALLGDLTGSALLNGCAAQVLLYAFVLSFPLPPLDGSDVWAHSRWGWLALWLAILLTFLGRMPEAFYDIL